METCYNRVLIFLSGMRKDLPIPTGTPKKLGSPTLATRGREVRRRLKNVHATFFYLAILLKGGEDKRGKVMGRLGSGGREGE